ncbi:amino acid/amide ABC transporter substrate-binding protein (HAAT family) [Williamsia limnetica]|jgi:branched-chain amino acid transport system substrate-binding protein|uniref:Amino acid/amide ABC transporter substrate-binding protein (HAAT family) n=1 Tax=Williamsia limnetica TaxID=882452 RepID=A0A318REU2_WILLI|nr:ABC transporter substrate-binding protein [Williamsia limnetica]PYE12196.1 amino acid/amide ABC transporter substrate-binding protein (HAAT family) [Williamsia limnetica]
MKARNVSCRRHKALVGVGISLLVASLGVTACSDGSDSSGDNAESSLATTALPANEATGAPIKIGFINSEGGSFASFPANRENAEAATEYINANLGGIGGRPIDLVVCKQQEEPASATSCANQMVEQKVSAVVVPGGAQGAAMLPILSGAGIPYTGPVGVTPIELTSPDSYMYTAGLPGVLSGMAEYSAKNGIKKIALLSGDGGGTPAAISAIGTPIFQAAGLELKVVPIPSGVPDPTPQVTAGLSDNPDAVAIVGDANMCITVLKTIQTVAPGKERFVVPTCVAPEVVEAVGGSVIEGIMDFTTVDLYSEEPDSVLYRSVMAQYAPDTDIRGYGYTGYQGVMGLYRVIQNLTGDVTPAAVTEALRTAKNIPLPLGTGLTFTCDGTAIPQLKSICSKSLLIGEVDSQGRPQNLTPVG